MPNRNRLALGIMLSSLACLYPGLTLPMMNINAGATLPLVGELVLYNETQSIIQTITTLIDNENLFVASLIFVFSVLVPVLKALILFTALTIKNEGASNKLHKFVGIIGKWSMADVFVVGVFIAFLATKSNPNINASLYPGFYYFTAYCILSIMGAQIMEPGRTFRRSAP